MNKKRLIFLLMGLISSIAYGASNNTTFTSSSTIAPSCTMSISDFNIGTVQNGVYADLPNNVNSATGTFSILCTKNTTYTVTQTYGQSNANGGQMVSDTSSDYITYGIAYYIGSTMYSFWAQSPLKATSTGVTDNYVVKGYIRNTAVYSNVTYPTPGNYYGTATLNLTY